VPVDTNDQQFSMKNKISKFPNFQISKFLYFFISLFPVFVLAQGLPPGRPITLLYLDDVIFNIGIFFIRISAVLTVIFIIWAGVAYMYAGDDSAKVTSAQNRLKSGIIGAAIIFGVGVILQTIVGVVTGEFFCPGVWVPIVNICV
jgi:hypothetical protein